MFAFAFISVMCVLSNMQKMSFMRLKTVEEQHGLKTEYCWKSVRAKSITQDNKQICWHFIQLSVLLVSAVKPLDVVSLGPHLDSNKECHLSG